MCVAEKNHVGDVDRLYLEKSIVPMYNSLKTRRCHSFRSRKSEMAGGKTRHIQRGPPQNKMLLCIEESRG